MISPDHPDSPIEENLFAAPVASERAYATSESNQPGPLAVTLSILVAILIAIPVFMATFFFTCLGLSSIRGIDDEPGIVVVFLIALGTAILSIVLVTRGLLALVRAFKSR
ncbi:MAG: hypothetical protein ACK58L_13080 [Planctomycetota bacterium]